MLFLFFVVVANMQLTNNAATNAGVRALQEAGGCGGLPRMPSQLEIFRTRDLSAPPGTMPGGSSSLP